MSADQRLGLTRLGLGSLCLGIGLGLGLVLTYNWPRLRSGPGQISGTTQLQSIVDLPDERHESEGEWKAEHCSDHDGIVVNHRNKQTNQKHRNEEQHETHARPLPVVVLLAVHQSFEEDRRQDARVRSSRTHLQYAQYTLRYLSRTGPCA